MKQSWQDAIRQTVVQISSFPGFALPIALYALLVQDMSSIVAFLISLFVLAVLHLFLKALLRTSRPVGYTKDHVRVPSIVDGSFPSNHTG